MQISDEVCEWLRGFIDGEGYFLIKVLNSKIVNKLGEVNCYCQFVFVFYIHLSFKDKDVL